MEPAPSTTCRRTTAIWGTFLLLLGIGWALSSAGVITADFWRFAGPGALVAVGASVLWPRLSRNV